MVLDPKTIFSLFCDHCIFCCWTNSLEFTAWSFARSSCWLPNNLGGTWRRICSPDIRSIGALQVFRNCTLQIDIYLLTYSLKARYRCQSLSVHSHCFSCHWESGTLMSKVLTLTWQYKVLSWLSVAENTRCDVKQYDLYFINQAVGSNYSETSNTSMHLQNSSTHYTITKLNT